MRSSRTLPVLIGCAVGSVALGWIQEQTQEPKAQENGEEVSDPSDFAGLWVGNGEATTLLWGKSPLDPDQLVQEFQVEGDSLFLIMSESEKILATERWSNRMAMGASARFSIESSSGSVAVTEDFVLIGANNSAVLIATIQVEGAPAVRVVFSRPEAEQPEPFDSGQPVHTTGYWTKIQEENDGIITLLNGGIVEVDVGFVGWLRYGRRALLHSGGTKLWIEGKKDFRVSILRAPNTLRKDDVVTKTIRSAADDGSLFVFHDGTSFEPLFPAYAGGFSEYQTCYIVNGVSLLLADGSLIEFGTLK